MEQINPTPQQQQDDSGTRLWLAVIGLVGSLATTLISAFMAVKMAELNAGQAAAAVKTEHVAEVLQKSTTVTDKTLKSLAQVAKDTHTLVNSNMGVQLLLNRDLSKRIADATKDPKDIAVATQAEAAYNQHLAKQASVDAVERDRERERERVNERK